MTELRKTWISDAASGATAGVTQLTDKTLDLDDLYGVISAAVTYARVNDTTVKGLRADASTEALMTLDYAHHEIHDGTFFTYDDVVTLGSSAVQYYLITTPDSAVYPHFAINIESTSGGITVEFTEGADRTGTTALTPLNRNRNSLTAATTTLHRDYSSGTTDGATKIIWRSIGTGTAGGKVSGVVGESTERVLKRNTKYVLKITSKAASNDVSVRFDWYEHTDRN